MSNLNRKMKMEMKTVIIDDFHIITTIISKEI